MREAAALDALASLALRRPKAVIATWVLAAAVGALFAVDIVSSCRFQFDPVPGTDSDHAQKRFVKDFPSLLNADVEVVVIECDGDCASGVAAVPFVRKAVQALRDECARLDRAHAGIIQNWTDYFEFEESAAARLQPGSSPFVSPSNRTMIFKLSWQVLPKNQNLVAGEMLDSLLSLVDNLDRAGRRIASPSPHLDDEDAIAASSTPITLAMTGSLTLFGETLTSTEKDLKSRHVFILPLALLVLLYRIRSWRLCLLPAFCLLVSLSTSMGLFVPFAKYVLAISPFAPTVMVFISMALSIDYSLFLLTRFGEEVKRGKNTEQALRTMLQESGHVVLVSGTVLVISYGMVLCFPGGGISTVGLGAALSIVACIATNLTLTPCAVAACPTFFTPRPSGRCRCFGLFGRSSARSQDIAEAFVEPERSSTSARNCWLSFANVVTRRPWSFVIPVACLALLVPPVVEVFSYHESFANSLSFPRSGKAANTFEHVTHEFPPGELASIFVLQPLPKPSDAHIGFRLADDDDDLMSKHFDDLCALANRLLVTLGPVVNLKPKDMAGLGFIPDPSNSSKLMCVAWPLAKLTLAGDGDASTVFREAWARLMSPINSSSIVIINPPFDPYSETMRSFVKLARKALPAPPSAGDGIEIGSSNVDGTKEELFTESAELMSATAIIVDIVDVSYERFPYILGTTIVLVFSVISIAFRAALAPFKMFFTVVVPLAAVFGITIWIYQAKCLDWLGVPALTSPAGAGIFWGAPLITCTIIIGLALDYDVFLFARVIELRRRGFDNVSAIRGAVCLTGPIITSAGLIMAIALGGLLLCDVPMNNQIGFIMAFGVLMDTFVIRTCLVPSVLTLAAGLNYWPQALPAPTKTDQDLDELLRGADDLGGPPSAAAATEVSRAAGSIGQQVLSVQTP